MKSKDCVIVIFFYSVLIISSKASKNCNYTKLEEDSVTFELLYKSPEKMKDIKWKHEQSNTIVARRNKGQISNVWGEIAENGSLNIKQIKRNYNGSFTVDAYDEFGSLLLKATTILCVYEKILKPAVNFTCAKGRPKLTCEFKNNKELTIIWRKDGKEFRRGTSDQEQVIKTENGKYQCTVSNPAHNDTSKEITTDCSTNESDKLFGFDFWVMLALLAGGGGLVILLIILLITCAWQRCKQQEKRQQDIQELRLNHLQNPPPYDDQRSKQTARGQPAPPLPLDEADDYINNPAEVLLQTQTKTKGQGRGRPPPPPIDEDEEPPPLPQPRKKAPRARKSQEPRSLQQ
ncbi:T-cell surface antigen CD2-like isoform X1 [Electrophorus electricus]|uniref:T-cell surface antigen CD2-like isoform X1 n=2 Tax=Electrophorus electricus TaxID=8005 RepID=UPI0015D054E4|nr:T-cell surface antigen CD2-like isoform X1 [Electrophorus electricus]